MENIKSKMFSLTSNDFVRGLVMAVISGFALPILAAIQTPDFNLALVNWGAIMTLALNGAVVGFASYLVKNFFSDENGRVLGKI